MLLVVVDQPRVRRRGEDRVEAPAERRARARRRAGPPPRARASAPARTPSPARACRARSGAGSARASLDRPALAPVLVAPVRRPLGRRAGSRGRSASSAAPSARRARARRAGRPRARSRSTSERKASSSAAACGAYQSRTNRELGPAGRVSSKRSSRASASRSSDSSTNGLYSRVLTRISRQLKAATSTPHGVVAALERLHERRPRARERVEHAAAAGDIPLEQRLDELRDELAEVRMEPVDVLRPLALGQLALRPRELEVDAAVERVLSRGHSPARFDDASRTPA